jgi:hypothetical protein
LYAWLLRDIVILVLKESPSMYEEEEEVTDTALGSVGGTW